MSKQLLTVLIAGIDIWAVLFIVHYRQAEPWDVPVVITNSDKPPMASLHEPIQVWLRPGGRMGVWPNEDRQLQPDEVKAVLAREAATGKRVEVRLLCDASLTLRQWARVAADLIEQADEIRIAPLPAETARNGP